MRNVQGTTDTTSTTTSATATNSNSSSNSAADPSSGATRALFAAPNDLDGHLCNVGVYGIPQTDSWPLTPLIRAVKHVASRLRSRHRGSGIDSADSAGSSGRGKAYEFVPANTEMESILHAHGGRKVMHPFICHYILYRVLHALIIVYKRLKCPCPGRFSATEPVFIRYLYVIYALYPY